MVKNTVIGVMPGDRESLPPLVGRSCVPLQQAWSKGWGPYSGFESFRSATLPAAMKAQGGDKDGTHE